MTRDEAIDTMQLVSNSLGDMAKIGISRAVDPKRLGASLKEHLDAALAALRSRPTPSDDLDRMGLTKEQVWHLHAYVVDHAADHEDECPGDDTCDCQFAARNAAVNAIVQTLIRHLPVVKLAAPAPVAAPAPETPAPGAMPECPNCGGMGTTFHDILVGGTEHDTEERCCEVCKGTGKRRQEAQP